MLKAAPVCPFHATFLGDLALLRAALTFERDRARRKRGEGAALFLGPSFPSSPISFLTAPTLQGSAEGGPQVA